MDYNNSSRRFRLRGSRVMALCNLDDSALSCVLDECLQHFPDIRDLRKEQKTCLLNLARGKDVFAIMPTGFGKSLIFQLFPRLAKAALSLENSTIIVVSPLISIMRDQVEQLKKLGFSAAAIGVGEEGEEDALHNTTLSHFSRRHRPLSQVVRVLFSLCSFNTSPLYYPRAWHRLPMGMKGSWNN